MRRVGLRHALLAAAVSLFAVPGAASGVAASPPLQVSIAVVGPRPVLPGDWVLFRVGVSRPVEGRLLVQARVNSKWRTVRQAAIRRRLNVELSIREAIAGSFSFRAVVKPSGEAAHVSGLVRVEVQTHGVRLVPRPGTTTINASSVASVSAVGGHGEIVKLDAGVSPPSIGTILAIPVSTAVPYGLLGRVRRVSRNADRSTTVATNPVPVDQAYSDFHATISGTVGDLSTTVKNGFRKAARPNAITISPLSCTGSGGTTATATIDLSAMHVEFDLTAVPPSIHFLLSGQPTLSLNLTTSGSFNCNLDDKLALRIPVPGTPIIVKIAPHFELKTDGTASITISWSPRIAIGFDRAPHLSSNPAAIGGAATSVNATLAAHANTWIGGSLSVLLGGVAGVTGTFGPELHATATAPPPCINIDRDLKANLAATADVFFKSFNFTLASGTYDNANLYKNCAPAPPPPGFVVKDMSVCPASDASTFGVDATGTPIRRCNHDYGQSVQGPNWVCSGSVFGTGGTIAMSVIDLDDPSKVPVGNLDRGPASSTGIVVYGTPDFFPGYFPLTHHHFRCAVVDFGKSVIATRDFAWY